MPYLFFNIITMKTNQLKETMTKKQLKKTIKKDARKFLKSKDGRNYTTLLRADDLKGTKKLSYKL